MAQRDDPTEDSYPTGRGYGHDYMRGGEVLGGYGYSARADYQRRRGDEGTHGEHPEPTGDGAPGEAGLPQRPRRQTEQRSPQRPLGAP